MNMAEIQRDETAHFKQYVHLIQKIAGKALPRAMALEPTMDYEEMVSFFCEVYVRCRAKFDPTLGYKFTTYLQTACFNDFNKWCDTTMKARRVTKTDRPDGTREWVHATVTPVQAMGGKEDLKHQN